MTLSLFPNFCRIFPFARLWCKGECDVLKMVFSSLVISTALVSMRMGCAVCDSIARAYRGMSSVSEMSVMCFSDFSSMRINVMELCEYL